jgi:hypothetical protein
MTIKPRPGFLTALMIAVLGSPLVLAGDGPNLVKNPEFEQAGEKPTKAAQFVLKGDCARTFMGAAYEISSFGIALDSLKDIDGDGKHEGSIAQDVPIEAGQLGHWYRFKIRGLPEDGFAVLGDNLHMKVDFFGDRGKRPLDGVTRKIYPLVEQERRDLTTNGVRHKGGAATWKTYAFEFRLPFPDIDLLRLSVGFRDGKGAGRGSCFLVDEAELEAIATPADAPGAPAVRPARPVAVEPSKLIALGGRWFYQPAAGEVVEKGGKGLVVDQTNSDRLMYNDGNGRYLNPFAENMSAWLKKGYLDLTGKVVKEDEFRAENLTITFDSNSMMVRAHNLPNHPTSKFPSTRDSGDRNPNYIQEQDATYYFPLQPEHNPAALAMKDKTNSNRALPMGPIGVAVNGVVFFNPFDMGMVDATDLMDRCCGHPNQDNQYHYHKYPVCVKSPFADEGQEHSPPIGWAFDGFAIHGPYEGKGVMAKDLKENPINEFNGHTDPERGFHYHVTPGKFPYILGGYWGKIDPRNRRGPGGIAGPGGGGPPGMPIMGAIDADHDHEISSKELKNASVALLTLDRNRDGKLSRDEIQPQGGPANMRGPGGPGGPGGGRPGGPPGGPGGGRPGGPGGQGPPPVLAALDQNRDGELSSKEISSAAESLKILDRNGDGRLTEDEFRPGPPGGGPPM